MKQIAAVLFVDAVGIAGAGLMSYGAWSIYGPAGYIVSGGFLLAFAWLSARR